MVVDFPFDVQDLQIIINFIKKGIDEYYFITTQLIEARRHYHDI